MGGLDGDLDKKNLEDEVRNKHVVCDDDDDDDWLEAEDELKKGEEMGQRDSRKVQGKLYDEGYRAGITRGKESMVQVGFDSAYNDKGAPLGRKYGLLLGSIHALNEYAIKRNHPLKSETKTLLSTIAALQIQDLAERDWEALEHESEHGADVSQIKRETTQEKPLREQRLDDLHKKVVKLEQVVLNS